jgi:hypothetical protein
MDIITKKMLFFFKKKFKFCFLKKDHIREKSDKKVMSSSCIFKELLKGLTNNAISPSYVPLVLIWSNYIIPSCVP